MLYYVFSQCLMFLLKFKMMFFVIHLKIIRELSFMKLRWFIYSFIDYANIRNRWIQVYIQISTQKRHFVHFTETFSAEMSCCSGKNNSRALSKSLCNKIYKWEAPLPLPSSWLSSLMLLPVLQQTNFHWSRWHHFFAKSLSSILLTINQNQNGEWWLSHNND